MEAVSARAEGRTRLGRQWSARAEPAMCRAPASSARGKRHAAAAASQRANQASLRRNGRRTAARGDGGRTEHRRRGGARDKAVAGREGAAQRAPRERARARGAREQQCSLRPAGQRCVRAGLCNWSFRRPRGGRAGIAQSGACAARVHPRRPRREPDNIILEHSAVQRHPRLANRWTAAATARARQRSACLAWRRRRAWVAVRRRTRMPGSVL